METGAVTTLFTLLNKVIAILHFIIYYIDGFCRRFRHQKKGRPFYEKNWYVNQRRRLPGAECLMRGVGKVLYNKLDEVEILPDSETAIAD